MPELIHAIIQSLVQSCKSPSSALMQMTAQLGPMPAFFTSLKKPAPLVQPQDPNMQIPATTVSQAASLPQSTIPSHKPSLQHPACVHEGQVGSISPQTGALSMWHERACPLHVELARVDPSMASMIMSMLHYDPQTRVSAGQALKHPFLKGLSPMLQMSQDRAEGTSDVPAPASAKHAAESTPLPRADLQTRSRQAEKLLPFRPEPQRRIGIKLPIGNGSDQEAAGVQWVPGDLPLPSDPLLRGPPPQLGPPRPAQSPQLPQLGAVWRPPTEAYAEQLPQPGTSRSLLESQLASPLQSGSQLQRQSQRKLTSHDVRPKTLETAHRNQDAGHTGDQAIVSGLVPSAPHADTTTAPADHGGPGSPCLAAQATGAPSTGSGIGSSAVARLLLDQPPQHVGSPAQELSPSKGQLHQKMGHIPGELAPVVDHTLDCLIQGAQTPQCLAGTPGRTPGVVKAWNGVAHLLENMTPASEVCS